MTWELRHLSCLDRTAGVLATARDIRPFVLVTDPPYTATGSTVSSRVAATDGRRKGTIARRVSYGELGSRLRSEIARVAALAEWAVIWDRPEGMGDWRRAIIRAGGTWLGVGIVRQCLGQPRLRGDAPGVRHLALALARRPRRAAPARWRGNLWAEWSETRPQVASSRPIVGTRSLTVCREIVRSCLDSCGGPVSVLDPCAGTGVIPVAAVLEGAARVIAWERDEATYDYALRVLSGQGPAVAGQEDLRWQ